MKGVEGNMVLFYNRVLFCFVFLGGFWGLVFFVVFGFFFLNTSLVL